MTRGHPPVVAIAEAMHYAERIGFKAIGIKASWLPCDFIAISEGKITLVTSCRISWHPAPNSITGMSDTPSGG